MRVLSFISKYTAMINCIALVAASGAAWADADDIFTNGTAYTVNDKQPWAEAVAVSDKEIVYVGDSAGAKEYIGEKTKVIDASGKMILHGFVSGHDHLIASNWTKAGVDLNGAKNKDETFALIKNM